MTGTTALLVIDMQMEMTFRTEAGRERVNPAAEERIADLLALFRARGLPVIHVHHDQPGTPVAFGLAMPKFSGSMPHYWRSFPSA